MQDVAAFCLEARLYRFQVGSDASFSVHDQNRQSSFDDRDGAMLEIRDRPCARENVARFAELQRYLLRGREVEATAEHYRARTHQRRHQRRQLVLSVERARDGAGHGRQRRGEGRVGIHRLRDQRQGEKARGVGLRRRHTELRARFHQHRELRGPGQLGCSVVGDRHRQAPLPSRLLDHRDHVRGFA